MKRLKLKQVNSFFVDDLSSNLIDRTIVHAVVNVANLLGVKVVGEGVESFLQLEVLKEIGCHEYQGYYLSKPCNFKDLKLNIPKILHKILNFHAQNLL
jgi:EAL domain-containing protein (putative c-di-GMP-specific phosphodiesterase class I)